MIPTDIYAPPGRSATGALRYCGEAPMYTSTSMSALQRRNHILVGLGASPLGRRHAGGSMHYLLITYITAITYFNVLVSSTLSSLPF